MHTDNKAGIVGETDFTNGQKLHFENVSVNVSHCVENQDANYLMVTMNHREKIFFIGQTSNALQYAGNISRFLRSAGGKICANVPTKAVAASERGNHKYWSMEILIATKANWDCIFNTLLTAGYKNLSSRNFLPPPESINIVRIRHTLTGWERFYSENTNASSNVSDSRRAGFVLKMSEIFKDAILANKGITSGKLTAYNTMCEVLRKSIISNQGIVSEVVEVVNSRAGIMSSTVLVTNLNTQATRNFSKFIQKADPEKYFGLITEKPPTADSVIIAKEESKEEPEEQSPPPQEEVIESKEQDTEKNVCDSIALNIDTMEQIVLLNISRKNKATRETIMELIDKYEFDIDNVCDVIHAAITKSDICNGFIVRGNEITKSKIKIALIEGTPPSAAGSLAFFEIALCIINEVISVLLSSEYRAKYTDTAYIMAA